MANFVKVTNTHWYVGAAADTKPTSCPSGSTCYEYDTGALYTTYNGGTNWVEKPPYRARNQAVTILASAARTAAPTITDQVNYGYRAVIVIVSVTASAATPAVTPSLQVKDSISGNYKTIWTAAAALDGTTGTYAYVFALGGAGLAGSFVEAVNIPLPQTWRLQMTHADVDSITYSVSAQLLV